MNEKKKYLWRRFVLCFVLVCLVAVLEFFLLLFTANTLPVYPYLMMGLLGMALLIAFVCYETVGKPYHEMKKIMRVFAKGYTMQAFFDMPYILDKETEKMLERLRQILNWDDMINASKKQAKYMALQNQINPHFLYNTLEGIRSEALCAGVEGVAKMAEALSLFFRYTISNMENLVTLEDELKNVENYYIIQQFRFEDRLRIEIDLQSEDEQELLMAKMPKLMLQPIVENAIYHGLEQKLGQGIIRIEVTCTQTRLLISISDNGLGISEDKVHELNKKLRSIEPPKEDEEPKIEQKGGIALSNVNGRIRLLFGEEYGLYVYSTENEGTEVKLSLPYIIK